MFELVEMVRVPREPTQQQKDAAGAYKRECEAHGRQRTVGGYYRAMVEEYLAHPFDIPTAPASDGGEFQASVAKWMVECFGPTIPFDLQERNHRFTEESLELVQACGMSKEDAHALVDYVYGRPVGEPSQEVGGTMVTLAALCHAQRMSMAASAQTELERINKPAIIEKIRAKQAAKPRGIALPIAPEAAAALAARVAEDNG